MIENRINGLAQISRTGEGILSLTQAPSGVHSYSELVEFVSFLVESGLNQLLMLCYEPHDMKVAEIAPSEIRLLKKGLAGGGYTEMFFDNARAVREKFPDLPLIATPMLGDVLCYGRRRFLESCQSVGVDGMDTAHYLAVDDPVGFRKEVMDAGIHFICAICPTALDLTREADRQLLEKYAEISEGEIFLVPSIPGHTTKLEGEPFIEMVQFIREMQKKHGVTGRIISIGGMNTPEDVYQMTHIAGTDGVHFSSAFIKKQLGGMPWESIGSWLKEIKDAMKK